MSESERARERDEEDAAAAEAARIGGDPGDQPVDQEQRPLAEAGQGFAEGFEQAEQELIDHASHGDQHSARVPYYDAGEPENGRTTAVDGEADRERSSEDDDLE